MSTDTDAYWRSAALDEAMQDKHGFAWRAMLDTIDVELRGMRVLDAGCNRGGFLRLLCDAYGIRQGWGYDPAFGAVDDARRPAGDRPLTFEVAETVPDGWRGFDVAFSHEVLYLIHDLPAHAAAIHDALVPGGVYFGVMGVHADSSLAVWHRDNAPQLGLPRLYGIDEVIDCFGSKGFEASVARLKMGFIPAAGNMPDLPKWVEYFYDHKFMLRFAKPLDG